MTYRSTGIARGPSLEDLVAALTTEPSGQKTVIFQPDYEAFGTDWLFVTCTVDKLERGHVYDLRKDSWRIEGRIVDVEGYPSTSGNEWPAYWAQFVRYRARYSTERGQGSIEWVTKEWITPERPTGFSGEDRAPV